MCQHEALVRDAMTIVAVLLNIATVELHSVSKARFPAMTGFGFISLLGTTNHLDPVATATGPSTLPRLTAMMLCAPCCCVLLSAG